MKVLTTEQIRAADAYTIKYQPIASIDLMERASRAFVECYLSLPVAQLPVTVVCGPGNNGGDGLAIARLLAHKNFEVEVWLLRLSPNLSQDCQINLERWKEHERLTEITSPQQLDNLSAAPVIIDAIFGSGISRGITGIAADLVRFINNSGSQVVSVDMPSGLFADQPNQAGETVEAHYTLSFQVPKLAFFLPQNYRYVGEWKVLDIGLSQQFIDEVKTNRYAVDLPLVQQFQRPQNRFAHKGNFGHAILVAGARGKMGAAILAARAAFRGGVGLLTVHIPACGYTVLQTAVPEAMCQSDPNPEMCTDISLSEKITTVGIGPGLGTADDTAMGMRRLLEQVSMPVVIDADGLNILSEHREYLELIPPQSILTPHPKEFERLAGEAKDDYHRLQLQVDFAGRYKVIIIYKGAHTTIALPDGSLYFNTSGNPGMATAGSGDVLTGFLTGLLARTGDPVASAIVGTHLHGLAGDLAARDISETSLMAGDIIRFLGPAINRCNLLL
jgi:NAD(P)H-hydrate epimerase